MHKQHPYYLIHWWVNWAANKILFSSTTLGWFEIVLFVLGGLTAGLGGLLQFCDPKDQQIDGWFKSLVSEIYDHRLVIFICLLSVQGAAWIAYLWLKWVHPIDLTKANNVLNEAVSDHFQNMDPVNHVYRATLFKIRGWRWLFGQWLGVICRSGEIYDQSGTIFSIDRRNAVYNTGFVGKCVLAEGSTIVLTALLDPTNPQLYKTVCGLDDVEFRNMNVKPKVVMTTGIKRNGKLWGVLVLDTTDPGRLPGGAAHARGSQQRHEKDIGYWAYTLGLLVD